jgi:membrane protein implicated in regulation of membrane protease activity
MDQIAWLLWLILGVGLIVAEIFTLGFVLFWFGIGAIAAAFAGFLGAGVGWQFLVFAVVSVGLTAMSRTIFAKYLPHSDADA